ELPLRAPHEPQRGAYRARSNHPSASRAASRPDGLGLQPVQQLGDGTRDARATEVLGEYIADQLIQAELLPLRFAGQGGMEGRRHSQKKLPAVFLVDRLRDRETVFEAIADPGVTGLIQVGDRLVGGLALSQAARQIGVGGDEYPLLIPDELA